MLKGETRSRSAFGSTVLSGSVANEQAAGSTSRGRAPLHAILVLSASVTWAAQWRQIWRPPAIR